MGDTSIEDGLGEDLPCDTQKTYPTCTLMVAGSLVSLGGNVVNSTSLPDRGFSVAHNTSVSIA